MKALFFLIFALVSTPAFARSINFGYWEGFVKTGLEGNYQCFPKSCEDSSPTFPTVNCKNLHDVMFSVSKFEDGTAPGYLWLSYDPDGPTEDDWELSRSYTIDGTFSAKGFRSTGIFKTPAMGSNGRVALRSMDIEMLPPQGQTARATIDFGGSSPMKVDLWCGTPGDELSGRDVDDHTFHNPPELCPSWPRDARAECEERNRHL